MKKMSHPRGLLYAKKNYYLFSFVAKINFDWSILIVFDGLRMNRDGSMKICSRTEKKLPFDFRYQRHVQVFSGQW